MQGIQPSARKAVRVRRIQESAAPKVSNWLDIRDHRETQVLTSASSSSSDL